MSWKLDIPEKFRKLYGQLPPEMKQRVNEALRNIKEHPRPEMLGFRKKGKKKDLWAYEIGRECRITYRPEYDRHVVHFFRVCSHKIVYL
jgi:mRNA-degrading endonuclease RelE of RelBE toxin-antitoxin system